MKSIDRAVRDYLLAKRNPDALKDEDEVKRLEEQLAETEDPVDRLRLRQQIIDSREVDVRRYEQVFVEHAKEWADQKGVGHEAFLAEGVDPAVLRRAGFHVPRDSAQRAVRRRGSRAATTRRRVSPDAVRAAIPRDGQFTIGDLQKSSGASPAVVRRVVREEVDAGHVKEAGLDPTSKGPGRSPVLYERIT